MHYEILDHKRQELLPKLARWKDTFYLAGGTGLALHIGHRKSIDFDFFSPEPIQTDRLFADLRETFSHHSLLKVQEEKNTLGIIVDETIKVSFMTYGYPILEKFSEEPFLNVASLRDIAAMKLSAIVSRATTKDYADMFFILKERSLATLLEDASTKYPELDTNLILKSLVYFDDIVDEPLVFQEGYEISLDEVKTALTEKVRQYVANDTA